MARRNATRAIVVVCAENNISITRASRATATRDLQDLVDKGALDRTGVLRHTRYSLRLADTP